MFGFGCTISTILLAVTLTSVPFRTAISESHQHAPCRVHRGFNRCVSEPIDFPGKGLWCSYHPCGPSFQPARKCARGNKKATHRCNVRFAFKAVYECIPGSMHKAMRLPVGCKGSECRDRRVCGCVQSRLYRYEYAKKKRVIYKCQDISGATAFRR